MRLRGIGWRSRRSVAASPAPLRFTPSLLGGGGGPAITVSETFFLSKAVTLRFVLGGILGVALVQVSIDGGPFSASILSAGSLQLPVAGSTVSLTLAAGVYALADYTGVI